MRYHATGRRVNEINDGNYPQRNSLVGSSPSNESFRLNDIFREEGLREISEERRGKVLRFARNARVIVACFPLD